MFSGLHEVKKIEDEVFLDRDGDTFETLVNYLRNDRRVFPEFADKNSENHFYKELLYWGVDSHNKNFFTEYLRRYDMSGNDPNQFLSMKKDQINSSSTPLKNPYKNSY